MLTDYHTHLTPDGVEDRAQMAASWERDGGYLSTEWIGRYVEQARARAIGEIAITEHVHRFRAARDWHPNPWWRSEATEDADAYAEAIHGAKDAGLPVLLGIEMDWLPTRRDEIARFLEQHAFDIVLGSVHWLADLAVDHPDYPAWSTMAADEVWRRYLDELIAAARSGLFDVLAHPDLPKVFGHELPPGLEPLVEDTLTAIADSGVAIECSSAGLRKRPRATYPDPDLLTRFHEAGVPVTLASDAHLPADVGRDYPTTVAVLRGAGYESLTRFASRQPTQVALGAGV